MRGAADELVEGMPREQARLRWFGNSRSLEALEIPDRLVEPDLEIFGEVTERRAYVQVAAPEIIHAPPCVLDRNFVSFAGAHLCLLRGFTFCPHHLEGRSRHPTKDCLATATSR